MIKCIINGKQGYPSLQSDIKVTRENPFVTNGDSFTMEVTFPMSIAENRNIFGPLHRMDVSKRNTLFDDCQLYADNILIIRGSGRATEITNTFVKIQIMGGRNSVRYKSKFQKIFIDRITTYPQVAQRYVPVNWDPGHGLRHLDFKRVVVGNEIASKGYVGDKSSYVFMPVYDIDNDVIANNCCYFESNADDKEEILVNPAVQPNLMMVLRHVMQAVGYTVTANVFDVAPWNELVIANARQTLNIAYALPHWTVDTFIDEFRKLFNASFIFDDVSMTVSVIRNSDLDTSNEVSYDVEEEFKTNYDESGIEYIGGSNIKYNLEGGDRTLDDFPQEVRRSFPIIEYNTFNELATAFQRMTEEQQFTNIFHCPNGYFFCGHKYNAEGEDTGEFTLQMFGKFGPLYRDVESDSFVELKMFPAEMKYDRFDIGWYQWANIVAPVYVVRREMYARVWMPKVPNPKGNSFVDYDEKGYVSVSNVLEDGETSTAEEEEVSESMPLMWVEGYAVAIDGVALKKYPASYTDSRNNYHAVGNSLSLTVKDINDHYIGELHQGNIRLESTVDVNNEICYQFLMDGMPDPTKVYVFRNKRYIASKIETKINEKGIERLKTGYFHEIKL